jgi:hypothetical protein
MNDLLELLKGRDLRSGGHTDDVAADAIQNTWKILDEKSKITVKVRLLENSKSAAVRNRVSRALNVLENDEPLPKGWSKIER